MTMGFSTGPASAKSRFRIVVLGPFSGSEHAPPGLHPIDGSSFDDTLSRVGGTLALSGATPVTLRFDSMKSLRPEGIAPQIPGGEAWLKARAILVQLGKRRIGLGEAEASLSGVGLDPEVEKQLVAALKGTATVPQSPPAAIPPVAAPPPPAGSDDPLGGLLSMVDVPDGEFTSKSPEAPRPPDPSSSAISAVIGAIAGSGKGGGAPPAGVAGALAIIDAEISSGVQAVLGHPDFQRFESAWRGLRFLLARVDFREGITLELATTRAGDIKAPLAKIAQEKAVGSLGDAVSLIVGADMMDLSVDSLDDLAEAATTAATIGAPLVVGAEYESAKIFASSPEWAHFRAQPASNWLGIAVNRFLLRLPFGADTEPVKDFPFEERSDAFAWGSPAVAMAAAVARSQARTGAPTSFQGREGALEDLPIRPTAAGQLATEHLIGPDEVRGLADKGLIVLAAAPERDVAFLAGSMPALRPDF